MADNQTKEVIRAKAFQLVNDNGDVVAELKTSRDGDTSFSLFDKDGEARLVAGLSSDGPRLVLNCAQGSGSLSCWVSNHTVQASPARGSGSLSCWVSNHTGAHLVTWTG